MFGVVRARECVDRLQRRRLPQLGKHVATNMVEGADSIKARDVASGSASVMAQRIELVRGDRCIKILSELFAN
jgi:hypothetical protein